MKTYLFNTETGLYEGETFENADTLQYVEGITPVPPPRYERGQVPVFDPKKNAWTILPMSMVHQRLNGSATDSAESKA
jgi:hypothetical protein